MSDELKVLYNFVKHVQNSVSPVMFIGKVSLIYFQIYLDGFVRAQWEMTGRYPEGLKNFSCYTGEYFDDNRNVGWSSIILSHTKSEEEAFETFYRLFEEYMISI